MEAIRARRAQQLLLARQRPIAAEPRPTGASQHAFGGRARLASPGAAVERAAAARSRCAPVYIAGTAGGDS
eukprot:scaffold115991_cov63-Phaeocystis_antarctica.AAC.5